MNLKSNTNVYFTNSTELAAISDLSKMFVEGDRIYCTDTGEWQIYDGENLQDYVLPAAYSE